MPSGILLVVLALLTHTQTSVSATALNCTFDKSNDWCGYSQSQSVHGLQWTYMKETDGNGYMGVEITSESLLSGKSRLRSPAIKSQPASDNNCLTFRYQFIGEDLALLHFVANVYNRTLQRYDQWYRREPTESKGWTQGHLTVNTPADVAVYIQLTIDVTSSSTPTAANDTAYGKVAVDDIKLKQGIQCQEKHQEKTSAHQFLTTGKSAQKTSAKEVEEAVIGVATARPTQTPHLTIVHIG